MTRDEVIAAVREVDARLSSMEASIEANAEAPLLSGEWRVRDALSHLAARSNPVPNVLRRLALAATPGGSTAPRVNVDDINAAQVDERTSKSITEILAEMHAGHQATIDTLPADDVLAQTLPAVQGGDVEVAEIIARSGARHENNHLNDVEAAIAAAVAQA
jgi:hypothetical protein